MERYTANHKFVLRKITDEYLLIPTESDGEICRTIASVNETAASVWMLLDKALTKREIIDAVTQEYDVNEATAEQDIENLLSVMLSHNYIKAV